MIRQEQIGEGLVRTYSDKGMMIRGGFPEADYAEAVDPVGLGRTYTETDIPIPDEPADEVEDMRNALSILGVSE